MIKLGKTSQYFSLSFLLAFLICQAASLPSFIEEPASQVVTQGQTIFLACKVKDMTSNSVVQWMRNGFGLGKAVHDKRSAAYPRYMIVGQKSLDDYTLMISNVQLDDDAIFECQVGADDNSPGLRSAKAEITVQVSPDEPVVDGGPKVEVIDGVPFDLTCHARGGRPDPTITWRSEGVDLVDNVTYSVAAREDGKRVDATSKLTIVARMSDQGKPFECYTQNSALSTSRWTRVYLEVNHPPIVTMQVNPSRRLRELSTVTFTCEAVANPPAVTWKWYRDGVVVEGQNSNTYVFHQVPRGMHTKAVECEATNKVNGTRQSFTLNIEYSPRIAEPAEHQAVNLKDDVTMRCTVDGNPPPVIVWRKKGSEKILSSTAELQLRQVSADDLGPYTCSASSVGFPDAHQDIYLFKKDKPIVNSETLQSSRFGDKGIIVCNVESIPKPLAINWTKHGEVIDFTKTDRYRVHTEDTLRGRKSILEIMNVQEEDFGEFNCSVANDLGVHFQAITFVHKDVLPLAYIIIGIPVGACIAIFIGVLVFIFIRRIKKKDGSTSDVSYIAKKEQPYNFHSLPHQRDTIYRSAVDFPRPVDPLDPRYGYGRATDYDELYPKDPRPYQVDVRDGGYGAYYGTYPGPAGIRHPPPVQQHFGPTMHYSEYGTYRPDYLASYGYQPASAVAMPPAHMTMTLPHPQSPVPANQLSTNV